MQAFYARSQVSQKCGNWLQRPHDMCCPFRSAPLHYALPSQKDSFPHPDKPLHRTEVFLCFRWHAMDFWLALGLTWTGTEPAPLLIVTSMPYNTFLTLTLVYGQHQDWATGLGYKYPENSLEVTVLKPCFISQAVEITPFTPFKK